MLNYKFSSLAALYAANVLDGGRTIDDVPAVIKSEVEKILGLSSGDADANLSAQE